MKHERLRRHGQHDRDEEFSAVLPGRPWPGWSRSANHQTAALGELIDWQRVSHHERADKVRANKVAGTHFGHIDARKSIFGS